MSTGAETIVLDWTHPHRGRLRVVLCPDHQRSFLYALRRLDIGCVARKATPADGRCTDCSAARTQGATP